MEAAGKIDRKTGAVVRLGKVTKEMMQSWFTKANVELRGAGLDESPDCYKRQHQNFAYVNSVRRSDGWSTRV
jgi:tRNA-splicing ligase RtcB